MRNAAFLSLDQAVFYGLNLGGIYENRCRISRSEYPSVTYSAKVNFGVLYVSPTGSDAASGTANAPRRSLVLAVKDLGSAGGKVFLMDGTHTFTSAENTPANGYTTHDLSGVSFTCTSPICLLVNSPVEIIGASGDASKVVLDAQSQAMTVFLDHADARLKFVTLSNGYSSNAVGGNLQLYRGAVEDCIFRDGFCMGHGGNLFVRNSGGYVSRCKFYGGRRTIGNGKGTSVFAIGEGIVLDNCLVADCDNRDGDPNGAAFMLQGGATAVNCTIANCSNMGGGAMFANDTSSHFVNCVVYNCNKVWGETNGSSFVNCAAPVAITGGVNCRVVSDPGFVDAANGDYSLNKDSALINAGDTSRYNSTAHSHFDLAGRRRITQNVIDIGAYELVQKGLTVVFF